MHFSFPPSFFYLRGRGLKKDETNKIKVRFHWATSTEREKYVRSFKDFNNGKNVNLGRKEIIFDVRPERN